MPFSLRPLADSDRPWLRQFLREHWGEEIMVDRGRVYRPAEQTGFLAEAEGAVVGVILYQIASGQCEIMVLESLRPEQGIGVALMNAVFDAARGYHCRRVWLITTNDNIQALKFYQKRGLRLIAVYPNAVDEARLLKPSIPLVAENGVPIRDELELELIL